MSMLVFGHKSPDTDSIISAIAGAHILTAMGYPAEACAQGEPGVEAKFVLEKFSLPAPRVIESVSGATCAIVDTTEVLQLPADITEADVKFVFDHHNLGGLKTKGPVDAWLLPVGSTATILYKYATKCKGQTLPVNIAGAMAMAIISDTVMFKSPTTTEDDKEAVAELAKIAGIDYEKVGMEMLREKSKLTGETPASLVGRDFKEFDFAGKKVGIGQLELIDAGVADEFIPGIRSHIEGLKGAKGYHAVVFFITDIMKEGSHLYVVSGDASEDERIANILGVKLADGTAFCPGLMSRKKQVIPPLTEKL